MKTNLILILLAMNLFSCGRAQQQQNLLANNSKTAVESLTEALADIQYTGEDALPELVFEDCDFETADDVNTNVIPQVMLKANRIVFKGDQVKFSDGKNEISAQIDLKESYEDVSSDGSYMWTFVIKDTEDLPKVDYISIETNYPVEQMEQMKSYLGTEHAPLTIAVDNIGYYSPKRFNQWHDLRRKLLANCPTNGAYYNNLDWANQDPSAEGLMDYEEILYIDADINHDGIDDLVRYGTKSKNIMVYCYDAKNNVFYEKTFTVQNENANSSLEDVSINEDGTIVIRTDWINSRGASGSDNYTARYQDDDLYLIGYDCQYQPYTVETYDLLTYQKTKETGIREEEMKTTTTTLKKLPLKKLSDIKIGEYHCEDY